MNSLRGALIRALAVLSAKYACRFCGAPFDNEAEGAAHSQAVHGQP